MSVRSTVGDVIRRFADSIGRPSFPATPFPDGGVTSVAQLTEELGGTGTFNFGGYIRNEDFNPQMDAQTAIKNFDEMRRGDSQVHAALEVVKLPIRTATYEIQPAIPDDPVSQRIADFVEWNLFERMTTSWDDVIRQSLLMLDFGFMVFEKVWSVQEDGEWAGQVVIQKLAPRPPKTIWQWFTDEDGTLISIKQHAVKAGSYQFLDVPASKLVRFTFQQEGDNFTGISMLRSAFPHWLIKKQLYLIDAIRATRFGVGIPRAKLHEGYKPTKDDRDAIAQMLQGLSSHQHAFLIEPPQMTVDILIPQTRQGGADILPSIEHQNEQITRNILAQFLDMGGGANGGSQALGSSAMDFFLNAIESIADQVCDVLNKQLIKDLVDMNFDAQGKYPTLQPVGIRESDVGGMATAAATLAKAGLLTPDPKTENTFRTLMNLPDRQENLLMPGAVNPMTGQPVGPTATPATSATVPATSAHAGPSVATHAGTGSTPANTSVTTSTSAAFAPQSPGKKPQHASSGAADEEDHSSLRAFQMKEKRPYTMPDGLTTFWRQPTTLEERVLDLRELPRRLDTARIVLGATLKGVREEQILRIASQVAHAGNKDTLKPPLVGKMADEIAATMRDVHTYGEESVRTELRKQRRGQTMAFGGAGSGNFGHEGRPGEVGGSGPSDGGGGGGASDHHPPRTVTKAGDESGTGTPTLGKPFIVYRLGRKDEPLDNRNAGNAEGVAHYAATTQDFESPQNAFGSGDHITAYRVVVDKPFVEYTGAQGGHAARVKDVGREAVDYESQNTFEGLLKKGFTEKSAKDYLSQLKGRGEVRYTFPKGGAWKAESLHSVPLKNFRNFDDSGTLLGADAIRAAFKGHVAFGGDGSGNYGHAGRPGEVGGSGPGGGRVQTEHDQYHTIGKVVDSLTTHYGADWVAHIAKIDRGFHSVIKDISKPDGGFTYDPLTGDVPKAGFALSVYKGHEFVKDAKDLSANDLWSYARTNWDKLSQADTYFGGWHNPKDGKVYLDISKVVKTKDEAAKLAREHNQLAYFDLATGQSVSTAEQEYTNSYGEETSAQSRGFREGTADAGGHLRPLSEADWPRADAGRREEDYRRTRGTPEAVAFAGRSAKKKYPQLLASAQLSALTTTEKLLASARAEALRLKRADWEADEIEDALKIHLGELADADITRIANMEVNEAFSMGRTAAAAELKDQIQSCTYSAILDNRVCRVCEKLDGEEFELDSDEYFENMPPNANCEGGDQCRCTYLYMLDPDGDGKGLSEDYAFGGAGSGNFDHAGRPGEVGGSGPGGGTAAKLDAGGGHLTMFGDKPHTERLAHEAAQSFKKLDAMLPHVIENADFAGVESTAVDASGWEGLSNEDKEATEQSWIEDHQDDFMDAGNEVGAEYVKDHLDVDEIADTTAKVIAEASGTDPAFQESAELFGETYQHTLDAKTIVYDPDNLDDNDIPKLDADQLRTVTGRELTETERDYATHQWTKQFLEERHAATEKLEESDGYYSVVDEARDSAIYEAWNELSGAEKMSVAVDNGHGDSAQPVDPGVPKDWEWESGDEDYARTGAIAREMARERTDQLLQERGLLKDTNTGLDQDTTEGIFGTGIGMSHTVWESWKQDSNNRISKAFQLAAARELGGVERYDAKDESYATEVAANEFTTYAERSSVTDAAKSHGSGSPEYKAAFAKLQETGMGRLQAYARAQWETTQYVLTKAGVTEVDSYRAVMLPREQVDKLSPLKVDDGYSRSGSYEKLPTLRLQQNGLASATTKSSIANGWMGVGNVPDNAQRVVIRYHAPREAVFSIPAFGQNIHSEQEVVMLGARGGFKWDAWKGRAPEFESEPVKFADLKPPSSSDPEWTLDITDADDGHHWLNDWQKFAEKKKLKWPRPQKKSVAMGGEGSGNFGHEGRPGEVGGSGPGGESASPARVFDSESGYRWHEEGPVAEWAEKTLSDDDRNVIGSYAGFGYKDINNTLRGNPPPASTRWDTLRPATEAEIDAFKTSKTRIPGEPLTLPNGDRVATSFSEGKHVGWVIERGTPDTSRADDAHVKAEKLNEVIRERGYTLTESVQVSRYAYFQGVTVDDLEASIGTTRVEKGFLSTMLGDAQGRLQMGPTAARTESIYDRHHVVDRDEVGTSVRFDISVPAGSKVLSVEGARRAGGKYTSLGPDKKAYRVESEVLLGSGARFKVISVKPGGTSKYVDIVKPYTLIKMEYIGGGSSEGGK